MTRFIDYDALKKAIVKEVERFTHSDQSVVPFSSVSHNGRDNSLEITDVLGNSKSFDLSIDFEAYMAARTLGVNVLDYVETRHVDHRKEVLAFLESRVGDSVDFGGQWMFVRKTPSQYILSLKPQDGYEILSVDLEEKENAILFGTEDRFFYLYHQMKVAQNTAE